MKKVIVVGAAGRVGFPFSLVLADAGYDVIGLDRNEALVSSLNRGMVPFIEDEADQYLSRGLENKNLHFTTDNAFLSTADVIAIMIGTPVDSENNPRLDDILNFVHDQLIPNLKNNTLVLLRSTVSPGTTELIINEIEKHKGWKEGIDYYLSFCPERVAQGVGIKESKKFPQLVGATNKNTFDRANMFFSKFIDNECIHLSLREAELGKLMTNMYRYVNFALANEFYMIANNHDVNVHKIIEACNKDYPRMNLAYPGPNVGGPCLFKDGKFLLSDIPFVEIIQTSFIINEGMPEYLFKHIQKLKNKIQNIAILGTAFKAGTDDERNSLSFKFAKVCRKNGIPYDFFDPHTKNDKNIMFNDNVDFSKYDVYVIMTPHKEFVGYYDDVIKKQARADSIMIDVWKLLPRSKETTNGIFTIMKQPTVFLQ